MGLDVKELIDDVDARYGRKGRKYAAKYGKRVQKLERKLEKQARHIPVDTPRDSRRRRRTSRRLGRGTLVLVVIGAAVAYVIWRRRVDMLPSDDALPTEAGPAPDVFGSAIDRAEPFAATRS